MWRVEDSTWTSEPGVTTRQNASNREIHHFIRSADRDDRKMRLDSGALESYPACKVLEQGINR